jgi:hypothetical protein
LNAFVEAQVPALLLDVLPVRERAEGVAAMANVSNISPLLRNDGNNGKE